MRPVMRPFMRPSLRPLVRSTLIGLAVLAALYLFAASAYIGQDLRGGGKPGSARVALFVNGTLGDKSFYDSAARGL